MPNSIALVYTTHGGRAGTLFLIFSCSAFTGSARTRTRERIPSAEAMSKLQKIGQLTSRLRSREYGNKKTQFIASSDSSVLSLKFSGEVHRGWDMSEFRKVVVGRKRRGASTSLQKCHAGLLREHSITPLHSSDAQIAALRATLRNYLARLFSFITQPRSLS